MKADWAHVFLSVLPQLPLETVKDETRIALALKSACASLMTKYALLTLKDTAESAFTMQTCAATGQRHKFHFKHAY